GTGGQAFCKRQNGPTSSWRSIRFVKSPNTICADRQSQRESLPYVLLWPHLLVAVLISTAWGAGMILVRDLHPLLHVSAFTIVLGSLVLIATEHMSFPEPYDPSLRRLHLLSNKGGIFSTPLQEYFTSQGSKQS